MAEAGTSAAPQEEEGEQMFVIKNLDTGLQMHIEDFDRLTSISAEEELEAPLKKKKGIMKARNPFKALGKKLEAVSQNVTHNIQAVSHNIKDKAQEINAQRKPRAISTTAQDLDGTDSTPVATPGPAMKARSGTTETEEADGTAPAASTSSSSAAAAATGLASSSSLPLSSAGSGSLGGAGSSTTAAAAGLAAGAVTGPLGAGAVAGEPPSAVPAVKGTAQAALQGAAGGPGGAGEVSTSNAAAAAEAPSTSTSNAKGPPTLPAAARLISHKRAKKAVTEAVWVQNLQGSSGGVIWAMMFSRDGNFLACAGQDGVLRVWQTSCSRHLVDKSSWVYGVPESLEGAPQQQQQQQEAREEPQQQPQQRAELGQHQQQQDGVTGTSLQRQDSTGSVASRSSSSSSNNSGNAAAETGRGSDVALNTAAAAASPQGAAAAVGAITSTSSSSNPSLGCPSSPPGPYFLSQPVREYHGHTEDILDISWSAAGFLLSASVDNAVRLWHLTQPDCLRTFWHNDFVTCVQFHPRDAQRFVTGAIDGKLRVWSITEARVLAVVQLHQDMVTALAFSCDGSRVVAGTMRGRCRFYDHTDNKLEYVASVDVRNAAGKHASGKKVTGIVAMPGSAQQFLVTTNDSRLRLLDGYGICCKFKGHRNTITQIRAALSRDGETIACGSDDGWVYLWDTGVGQEGGHMRKDPYYTAFQAHEASPVVVVGFAHPGCCRVSRQEMLAENGKEEEGPGGACSSTERPGGGETDGPSSSGRSLVGAGESGAITVLEQGSARAVKVAGEELGKERSTATVRWVLVSGAFNGQVRVHELHSGRGSRFPGQQ